MKNNRIISRSSSNLSRFSNSLLVRVLCILTCLWIIFGPIYLCLRSAGSVEDKIVADYTMLMSGDDFIRCNAAMITNAAMTRSHQRYIAYFSWFFLSCCCWSMNNVPELLSKSGFSFVNVHFVLASTFLWIRKMSISKQKQFPFTFLHLILWSSS